MRPKSIKRIDEQHLKIIWADGTERMYPLRELRDQCPCAGCAGETVLMHEYRPPEPDRSTPGRYEIRDIQLVGSYAMQVTWGDGHNSGIYQWEFLRNFSP